MQNLKIKNATTELINLISEEADLNIEDSIRALIEQLAFDLEQEQLFQEQLNRSIYRL